MEGQAFQIGDVQMYFREGSGNVVPPYTRAAIRGALVMAGLIPGDVGAAMMDIADFKGRGGQLLPPKVRVLGRSGWNEPGK